MPIGKGEEECVKKVRVVGKGRERFKRGRIW
jgi:hypothetical protein